MWPTIETRRLQLRLPPPAEAEQVSDYFRRNADRFERWDPPRPRGFYRVPYWQRRLTSNRSELRERRSLRLFLSPLTAAERIIGHCCFSHISPPPDPACLLGFGLDHSAEGCGLMTEALRAAIDYVFEELGLERIQAGYRPDNERSARLLEGLGFVVEGRSHNPLMIGNEWSEQVQTVLTRRRWRSSR